VLELLRRRFTETLGARDWPLDADTPLRGMLGADSLDLVELVMELEEQFDIDIPDEMAQDIRTFGDLIRYLERQRRGKPLGLDDYGPGRD
jgi:acyl carrier protein